MVSPDDQPARDHGCQHRHRRRVIAPSSASVTLRLTVTDDQGRTDTADVVVEPNRSRHHGAGLGRYRGLRRRR